MYNGSEDEATRAPAEATAPAAVNAEEVAPTEEDARRAFLVTRARTAPREVGAEEEELLEAPESDSLVLLNQLQQPLFHPLMFFNECL